MSAVRGLVFTSLVLVAVVLQISVFSNLAFQGVVPNLVLLVVVATALGRGPEAAAVLGLLAGLMLDLAPPADHAAGRWALALIVVGYLAGRVRQDAAGSAFAAVVTVAACSFVGTSIFAISGLVLGDPGVTVGSVLQVVPISLVYDVLLTPLVLPPVLALLRRLEERREVAAW